MSVTATFVIGLGNPGPEYERTRHNVGFMLIDALQRELETTHHLHFKHTSSSKFHADVYSAGEWVLAKPTTFMNESGRAVQALSKFYHPDTSRLYVVHDDLDLEVGAFKIQFEKGPKVHNGLSSIDQELGTKAFWHVRVGVDGRAGDRSQPSTSYVLQPFTSTEVPLIESVIGRIVSRLLS